jgi:segregation and condensation protein B
MDSAQTTDESQDKRIVEALLFVFGQPLPIKRLLETLPGLNASTARALIDTLNAEYEASGRAFHIQEVAGGYQLLTDPNLASWIQQVLQTPKPDAVSPASLETLAIIAYRQPITKAEIELIRGVDVAGAIDTLIERKFVRTMGRKDGPGRPFLYGTTTEFLRHFKLESLGALPKLAEPVVPEPQEASPVQSLSA